MMEASVPFDNTDANEEGNEWPALTQTYYDFQRNIRAPKGFFGMRGKKDFTNAEKRALMGIQQVRMRCLFACSSEHLHFTIFNIYSFTVQNLNGIRGRTRFIEAQQPNIDENLIEPQPSVNSNQGYFGVRAGEGKNYVRDYGVSGGNSLGEKRAPKGFMGMRGKKRDGEANDDDFESDFYAQKRVPSGFTGVRGKKDSSMFQ